MQFIFIFRLNGERFSNADYLLLFTVRNAHDRTVSVTHACRNFAKLLSRPTGNSLLGYHNAEEGVMWSFVLSVIRLFYVCLWAG